MIKRLSALMFIAVLAALAVSACSKKQEATAQATAPGAKPAAGAAAGPAAAPGAPKPVPAVLPDVVAKVNGESIMKSELEMAVHTLEQRDAVFRQVLDRLIGFHLLVQEARTRKVVAAPWEVDNQIAQLKKQFPNEEAFKQMLDARGVTLDRLRKETEDTIAVNQMLQKEIEPQVQVKDPDLKNFFDQNKPRFRQDDSVHARHILIRADAQADAATKAKAKSQADDLLKQIRKGADFADLAKKFSQDTGSAQNGGDLPFFSKGQMVAPFEQAAFALKVGQTSGVVETPFGYHIIQVMEAKPGRDLPFDEVKEQIREYLTGQQREAKSQAFVDQIKAKGKIEIII